jgi:hypothetical protein
MNRFLAILLAVFIGGPTCLCVGSEVAPPPPVANHSCCHADGEASGSASSSKHEHAPANPCGCNKCLVKRLQAGDPPQVPAITWTFSPPLLTESCHDILMRDAAPAPAWLIDTGPPHERQAIFARHCALLL